MLFDIPGKIYAGLVERFGPFGAGIVAGVAFLLLLAFGIGLALVMKMIGR